MDSANRQKVFEFLRSQKLAVISTVHASKPGTESALIAFTEDENLCLYFQTGKHTRKAHNLAADPHISLVFGLTQDDMVTVQYEGTAKQLATPKELEQCRQRFIAKDSPTTEEYFNHPSAIFFKVTPVWIGCSDYTGDKPEVIEVSWD